MKNRTNTPIYRQPTLRELELRSRKFKLAKQNIKNASHLSEAEKDILTAKLAKEKENLEILYKSKTTIIAR
jgi:hypothetical protein